jgi:tetratricopeptide (TPR) repeat protein
MVNPFDNLLEKAWNHSNHLDDAWNHDLEEEWKQAQVNLDPKAEQQVIKDSALNIINVLQSQGDPKFTNSEFFKFVSKIHTGQVKIQGDQIIENFEDVWTSSNQPHDNEEKLWDSLSPEERIRLEEAWKEAREDYDPPADEIKKSEAELLLEWGKAWSDDRQIENPYSDMTGLQEVYEEMMKKAEFGEAILMMEAELQNNPSKSSEWLTLGRLYSYLDRDDRALEACRKGLEADPYNLELLFAAGVASLAQFEHGQLAGFFSNWLAFNVDYSGLHVPQSQNLELVKSSFLSALEMNPQDHNLYSILGLIEFALARYEEAEYYFLAANSIKQGDRDTLNRIGASLMQQSKYQHAIEFFNAALECDKEYVRAWVNLGKGLNALGDWKKAAGAYLTAATLYDDGHLFELARSAFAFVGRNDLVERLKNRNPMDFIDEFEVINLKR